jgi:hypothetical protein
MKALSIKHIAQIRRDAEILAALGVKNDVDRRKPADQGATVGRQPQASQRNQLPDRARCPIGTRRTASPMNRDGYPTPSESAAAWLSTRSLPDLFSKHYFRAAFSGHSRFYGSPI